MSHDVSGGVRSGLDRFSVSLGQVPGLNVSGFLRKYPVLYESILFLRKYPVFLRKYQFFRKVSSFFIPSFLFDLNKFSVRHEPVLLLDLKVSGLFTKASGFLRE